MSNFPEDLKYTKSHEWVKKDGDLFLIGISDFAQGQLGDIVYVDFPEVGDEITAGEVISELESSKAVSELNIPFDGEIVEINEKLEDSPELINTEPYKSWIVKFRAADPDLYNSLLTSAEAASMSEES